MRAACFAVAHRWGKNIKRCVFMAACVCTAETGRGKKKGDKARERMGGRKREGTTQWDKNNLG